MADRFPKADKFPNLPTEVLDSNPVLKLTYQYWSKKYVAPKGEDKPSATVRIRQLNRIVEGVRCLTEDELAVPWDVLFKELRERCKQATDADLTLTNGQKAKGCFKANVASLKTTVENVGFKIFDLWTDGRDACVTHAISVVEFYAAAKWFLNLVPAAPAPAPVPITAPAPAPIVPAPIAPQMPVAPPPSDPAADDMADNEVGQLTTDPLAAHNEYLQRMAHQAGAAAVGDDESESGDEDEEDEGQQEQEGGNRGGSPSLPNSTPRPSPLEQGDEDQEKEMQEDDEQTEADLLALITPASVASVAAKDPKPAAVQRKVPAAAAPAAAAASSSSSMQLDEEDDPHFDNEDENEEEEEEQ
jgi:hypothetical protein